MAAKGSFLLLLLTSVYAAAAAANPKVIIGDTQTTFIFDEPSELQSFSIDRYAVSNAQFRVFVRDTKHKTEAERVKWSYVFENALSKETSSKIKQAVMAEWWIPVPNAFWRRPQGPDSTIAGKDNLPVVHISWDDAVAYCAYAGKRLPTEAEWDFAAAGSKPENALPWPKTTTEPRMNIFQGRFPRKDYAVDGYKTVAPVDAFGPQNDYGVFNMLGNVWEWVSDIEPNDLAVQKGGSYIDSIDGSFNHRVELGMRHTNTKDAGSDNLGFRCASSYTAPPERSEL